MTVNGWPLATVAELQRKGIALVEDGNHGEYRPRPDEFVESGTAFIRAADLNDGVVDFGGASKINPVARKRITKGIGAAGDVLLSHKGTVGKLAFVPNDAPPFVCSPQTTFWRTLNTEVLDRKYLFSFLRSPNFHAQLATRAGETDMAPYVSLTSQRGLSIVLPPIDEQRAIAHILGTLDDKIDLNRRMNETLEAMARALFKSWFVDFDPVRAKAEGIVDGVMQPHISLFSASLENSELGPIPAGWKVGKIVDGCKCVQNGGTPSRSEARFWDEGRIPWLTSGEVREPIITEPKYFITEAGLAASSAKWVDHMSTVVALYGATAGQVSLVSLRLTTNQAICALMPKDGFLFFNYMWMRNQTPVLERKAVGSAQQNISKGIVEETRIVLPPPVVLERFNSMVGPIFSQWISGLNQSRTLGGLRDTLLPKVISGELRVKAAEKMVEAAL